MLTNIKVDVKALTVPAIGQTKAQAISQLKALIDFASAQSKAKGYWNTAYENLALNDHGTNESGPAYMAERPVVQPMGISICNLITSNSWPASTYCPFNFIP